MPPQSIYFPVVLPGLNDALGKANQRYGQTNAYAKMKVQLETDLQYYIKTSGLRPMQVVSVEFLWKERNERRDPDNIVSAKKFVLDAMVKAGILPGDGWTVIKGMTDYWEVDTIHPGVVVTLTSVEPGYVE